MPFGERLISSSANNSFTRRDNAEAIFSKVDKVGLLSPRSIDLMCRKDKPDFSANCSCFNFRERRSKRIVIPKDF